MQPHRPLSHRSLGLSFREKPQLSHVIVGAGTFVFSYFLLLQYFRPFLAEATHQLLSYAQIAVEKPSFIESPMLVLRLMNGSNLSLVLTWQRSGLFSIVIFGLLSVLLAFPLRGPLWLKIVWLEFGSVVGLAWSLVRFSTAALVAYHFGMGAFALCEFVMGPVVDFLWVIPVWSLGLSAIISKRRKSERALFR